MTDSNRGIHIVRGVPDRGFQLGERSDDLGVILAWGIAEGGGQPGSLLSWAELR